ncbi:hypothetical protein [Paenibacillus taiwanensis]|uniref:hypothetical protein n=1 Tax=Paenibacillus taiwanensis TaxID=401638 RepID=UPI000416C930|nr:hypothetical protein [Paenibacillus taiwanensis]
MSKSKLLGGLSVLLLSSALVLPVHAAEPTSFSQTVSNTATFNWGIPHIREFWEGRIASYGTLAQGSYTTPTTPGWIVVESVPDSFGPSGFEPGYNIYKYILTADPDTVEREIGVSNLPPGWVEIGRGYTSSHQFYRDIKKELILTPIDGLQSYVGSYYISVVAPGAVLFEKIDPRMSSNYLIYNPHIVYINSLPIGANFQVQVRLDNSDHFSTVPSGWKVIRMTESTTIIMRVQ